jgi:ATP-dependent Zn protease
MGKKQRFNLSYIFFLMRRMQAGPAGMMTLGKNEAKLVRQHDIETRFANVAVADEAKEELNEVGQILAQLETRVTQLVTDKKATLIAVAKALLGKEVLMKDEFVAMIDAGMAPKDAPA